MTVKPPLTERPRPASHDARLVKYDQYIDDQIRTTRRMVKLVDVMTVLTVTTLGVLAFLLATAVVEHWLLPSGFSTAGRFTLFAILVGSVAAYWYLRLWPLVMRPINPVYAAHSIEQASPTLKNSLLNLLLFRQRRTEITDAVYKTLEQQAAERLVHVPVDTAVDRSHLLRLGYVLVAIVAAVVLYKILSPKDPLVTAERVLMPWADVVPASRVSISNVEPGNITLARGEVLDVAADVRGIGPDDPVYVRYTTADGQAVNRPVQMKPTAAGLRFVAKLPDAESRSADDPIGIAQDLRYRIEAGDARSLDYSVTVVAAPTITVERIGYEYPAYTGYSDREVKGIGDIRAIEGTRVTIHGRANGPINEAQVDFEADGRRDVAMEVDGTKASGAFTLALRDDRQTPRFTSYVLRYTGTDGRPNRDPVKFSIDVEPDYQPEVSLLAPKEKVRDVWLNETITIEVDAIDPDFGLVDVRLQGEVAGKEVVDERLLKGRHVGRFTGRFGFTPSEHGLQVGDVVRYWALARDVRQPKPNEAKSEPQTLRIISPDPNQPPPDRVAQRDRGRQQQQPGENQQQGDGQQGDQQGNEQGQQQPSGGQATPADGNEQQQDGQPSGEPGAGQQPAGKQQGQSGGGDAPARSDDERSPAKSGDQPFSRDAQRSADPRQGQGGQSQDSQRQQQGENANQRRDQSPVSSEGDNDGEAFDRIREFLQREGELPKDGEPNRDAQQDAQPNANGEPASDADSRQQTGSEKRQQRDQRDAASEGPGADTRSESAQDQSSDKSDQRDDSQKSPGGQETSSKGPSGAGERPQENQGAPDSPPDRKPADKWQQKPSGDQSRDDQEPPAGGRGKRENDSQGDQGGDVTGGGEEGGGQQADREGTGSAGQNQSADEGSGQSSEQGRGDTSTSAGRDATAEERTGESGNDRRGEGSRQRDGAGDQPGGQQGEQSGGEDAPARSEGDESRAEDDGHPFSRDAERSANDDPSQQGQQGEQRDEAANQPRQDGTERGPSGDQSGGPGSTRGTPGETPSSAGQSSASNATAPEGDAANLEYARKQTDLVLEKLSDQLERREVDKRMLDELGWSEDDLKQFLQRWNEMKAAAEQNTSEGNAASRELDDALRSLGLRRGKLQQNQVRQDEFRDLREGYRGAVPLEYQERLKAYTEGVSRARRGDE